MVVESNYLAAKVEADAESVRLGLLEQWRDPATFRRLEALGLAPGSRCLEVGAGRGSVARWLSAKVGPGGTVVAADMDLRFLTGLPDNVEVRSVDIGRDDLEPETYDVVHCRALLNHLPDPLAALRRMVAALRPGGVLLAEEFDFALVQYGGHADAEWATELFHRQLDGLASAKATNLYLGRALPGLLTDAGLELMGGDIDAPVTRFGEHLFELHRLSLEAIAPGSMAFSLLSEDEHMRVMRLMQSPSTVLTLYAVVAAWARRADAPGQSAAQ